MLHGHGNSNFTTLSYGGTKKVEYKITYKVKDTIDIREKKPPRRPFLLESSIKINFCIMVQNVRSIHQTDTKLCDHTS